MTLQKITSRGKETIFQIRANKPTMALKRHILFMYNNSAVYVNAGPLFLTVSKDMMLY
jgi:hypothetical protein